MIYQAEVTLHLLKALVFVPGQLRVEQGKTYKLLVSPDRDKLRLISIPDSPLCNIYLSPCKVNTISPTCCQLTHLTRSKDDEKGKEVAVLTIKSAEACIKQIQSMCPRRRYKSCLSFQPSNVRHVSILSGESTTQRYRGFINLVIIMFVILNLRNMVDNFYRYGARFKSAPFDFIPVSATIGMASLYLFVELAYRLDRLRFHRRLGDLTVRILLKVNQVMLLVYIGIYCHHYGHGSPISFMLLTVIGMVTFLKLVSYMQVNTQLFHLLNRSASLKKKQFNEYVFGNHQISEVNLDLIVKHRQDWQPLLSRGRLAYFLVAPTLCYQLVYPRSPQIRPLWLLKRFVELVVVALLLLVLWVQYMQPELEVWLKLEEHERTWLMTAHRLMRLSIPNVIGWILGFYAYFHLGLNMISEIIRFGDRNFYMDWWNCRNLQEYWKTWNLPVHFFFIRHVYTPLLKRGWSKLGANILVFFASALAHQYLVCVPLGVFTYYAFLAMMLQAPAIFIERTMSKALRLHNSELGNVSFWLFFCFLGQPICIFIYYSLYMQNRG